MQPRFSVPRQRQVTLSRPVFVKGAGLPKDGVCLFREREEVTIQTDNGADWYLLGWYRGRQIKVATLIGSL